MFLTSVVLSVGLTTVFTESFFPNINQANPNFVSPQVPSMTQEDQHYSSNMPLLPMEGNQNFYPVPQPPMMQGFQPPFPFNSINQQQLSLLLMSTYARMITLIQLMNMQNKYQPYNQYSDPAVNNFVQPPVPLPYIHQPQVETQNNLQNELLQQQQQAEAQQKAILEERRIQREYDMEIQRRDELIKRQAEEEEIENKQQEIERQLLVEEEIKEARQQILEEEQKDIGRKKKELKPQKIEDEKLNQNKKKTYYVLY